MANKYSDQEMTLLSKAPVLIDKKMRIAHIVLPVPLVTHFDYLIPEHMTVIPSVRVIVPFGQRNRIGIVSHIDEKTTLPANKLKPITTVIDKKPLFSNTLWSLLFWAAKYYFHPVGEVLFHALPTLLREGNTTDNALLSQWIMTNEGKNSDLVAQKLSPAQYNVMQWLQKSPLYPHQITALNIKERTLRALEKRHWIQLKPYEHPVDSWCNTFSLKTTNIVLNAEQLTAINAIIHSSATFLVWLLNGITGSGKTEVYLNALTNCLQQGKQALILVPEIGLTPQTIARFKQRFNTPIDVLHSALNDNDRLAVWLRARRGENALVIGTRSAIFTPFKQLGMIIIDEEHDNSYKQQEGLRYHARDLAILRARKENIPIILGSATPSLESLHNIQTGKYHLLTLSQRAGNAQKVKQSLIDLKGQKLTAGLSSPLIAEIRKHLQANNQVILFLNRRGYSPVLLCHDCGWLAQCPRCEHYYTTHKHKNRLYCHHCDGQKPLPAHCPNCHSSELVYVGVGTEQLELTLKQLFPHITVNRIDKDTTSKKGSLEKLLDEIAQGGARILVGTQIIAKGHHFPDVTLVGIIDVDGALFSTDFRATEYLAQLFIQVSGRAGRQDKPGEVVLQTHHPENLLLQTLLKKGYDAFASELLLERQAVSLPPFSHQSIFRAKHHYSKEAETFLSQVKTILQQLADDSVWILGPTASVHAKKAGKYHWQLLVQHSKRQILHQLLDNALPKILALPLSNKIKWDIDIDPVNN